MTTVHVRAVGRTGLFPEHTAVGSIQYGMLRLTIPAREALAAAGHRVDPDPDPLLAKYRTEWGLVDTPIWQVTLAPDRTMPRGLVWVGILGYDGGAVRLDSEPEYPGEVEAAWWERAALQPCPRCGAPLVWYEAGYVPGYRVCGRKPHHHLRIEAR